MSLDNLIHGLESIRLIDEDMPVQHLLVLLTVARYENQNGGLLITRIAQKAQMSLPGASRAVRQMGPINRDGGEGLNLMMAQTNWSNQRQKHVKLTNHGRGVVDQFVRIVNGVRDGDQAAG